MDYFELLNLASEPFSNSPDPDFFFGSRQHKGCLQRLEISLRLHRGLNLIVGDVGTGKTTLCRQLIRILAVDEQIETHLILDPQYSNPFEFLNTMAAMLAVDLPEGETNELKIKERIKNCLYKKGVDEHRTVLLIIDEGQKIPEFCLEILREFLNFETNKKKLLQIAIFAQKEFKHTLQGLGNFTDRINLFMEIGPLNFRETRSLIRVRLKQSSGAASPPAPFSAPAFWCIYRTTRGYPRQIITLCHQLILAMIVQNRIRVGWLFVRACAVQLYDENHPRPSRIPVMAGLAGLLAVTAAVGLMPRQVPAPAEIKVAARETMHPRKINPPHASRTQVERTTSQSADPEPVGAVRTSAAAPQKETGPHKPPPTIDNPPSSTTRPSQSAVAPDPYPAQKNDISQDVALETIRAARHPGFFRIVFEFDQEFLYEKPVITETVVVFHLRNVTTNLKPVRTYKTFDAWVKLDRVDRDLDLRIGMPENFEKIKYSLLKDPQRLVVDIYTRASVSNDS